MVKKSPKAVALSSKAKLLIFLSDIYAVSLKFVEITMISFAERPKLNDVTTSHQHKGSFLSKFFIKFNLKRSSLSMVFQGNPAKSVFNFLFYAHERLKCIASTKNTFKPRPRPRPKAKRPTKRFEEVLEIIYWIRF